MRSAPYLFLLAVAWSITSGVAAQSVEQYTAWGDASMAKEEFYGASRFYAGALALEPGRMSLQWKQAEACRLSNQYPEAIALYTRVHEKDGSRTYPEALRWLGEMQLCDARYTDAETTWSKVLLKEKDKGSPLAQRARNAMAGCQLALKPIDDTDLVVNHLPAPVNTNDSEFGARTGADSTLWFSSLRGEVNAEGEVMDTAHYRVAVFSTTAAAQGWSQPVQEQGPPDAMGYAQANLMWTPDATRMFFTMIDRDGTKYLTTRTTTGPADQITGLELYPEATQPWATMLNGQPVLFFTSPGGEGGTDIWYGDLNSSSVVNIRNAGPLVNSPGNESSPSFDTTTGTLLFSSDHHPGLGGYDIFRSTWSNGSFGAPVNLVSINSPANDLYPVFDANSGTGWLTSNRKGSFAAKGETCCNDIYRIRTTRPMAVRDTLPNTAINTIPDTGLAPLLEPTATLRRLANDFPLRLYFHNDEPEPRTHRTTTGQDYTHTYEAYRKLIGTYRNENDDPSIIEAFFAEEAEKGRRMLDELVQALIPALEHGDRITLDVRGHASPLARNDYNKNLSLRRIESLRNHLRAVEQGRLGSYMDSSAVNGGVLRLRILPFGEEQSAAGISDDRNDLKRSVYSVEAARERRIEVERVHIAPTPVVLNREMHFFIGTVRQGVPQHLEIPVVNKGPVPITITHGRTACDCIILEHVPEKLPPGGMGTIGLQYTGRTRPGPMERLVSLEVEGSSSSLELTIRGNVIE